MVLQFADLISGLLGLLAAILLGAPALFSLLNKKRWGQINRLKARVANDPEGTEHLASLREHYLNRVLGPSRLETLINVIGYGLLVAAFGFLLAAGLDRAAAAKDADQPGACCV